MAKKKKRRTHVREDTEVVKGPKSFVMKRGKVGRSLRDLVLDLRRVMEPNTATRLKETAKNRLKDFVNVAGPLGVTHLTLLTMSDIGANIRIARMPRGPTLTFKIEEYSLTRDVLNSQTRPHTPGTEFLTAPLVVLNNFGGDAKHVKLMSVVFQSMFPSINVQTVKISMCKRVVFLSYDAENDAVEFRHFVVTIRPTGVSKALRGLINSKIPDLGNLDDISEFVLRYAAAPSESEGEDAPMAQIPVPGGKSKGARQSKIKLYEMGPRIRMQLLKIEEGFCTGTVLFHRFVSKTPEEIARQNKERMGREKLRKERRAEQERNVARKKAAQEGASADGEEAEAEAEAEGDEEGNEGPEPMEADVLDMDAEEDEDEDESDSGDSDAPGPAPAKPGPPAAARRSKPAAGAAKPGPPAAARRSKPAGATAQPAQKAKATVSFGQKGAAGKASGSGDKNSQKKGKGPRHPSGSGDDARGRKRRVMFADSGDEPKRKKRKV